MAGTSFFRVIHVRTEKKRGEAELTNHFCYRSIGTYGSDQVALGMHDKRMEAGVQKIDIVAKYVHPQYDTPDRSHDVGMLLCPSGVFVVFTYV